MSRLIQIVMTEIVCCNCGLSRSLLPVFVLQLLGAGNLILRTWIFKVLKTKNH